MLIKRVVLTILIITTVFLIYVFLAPKILGSQQLATPSLADLNILPVKSLQSPPITSTPTPVPINKDTNLYQFTQSLTPQEFGSDYTHLQELVDGF